MTISLGGERLPKQRSVFTWVMLVKCCFPVKMAEDPGVSRRLPRGTDRSLEGPLCSSHCGGISSRADVSFGFEGHYIWGLARMKVAGGDGPEHHAVHGVGVGQKQETGSTAKPGAPHNITGGR